MSLRPISPCCGDSLAAKIGTEIIVCENCNREYQIIQIQTKKDMMAFSQNLMEKMK